MAKQNSALVTVTKPFQKIDPTCDGGLGCNETPVEWGFIGHNKKKPTASDSHKKSLLDVDAINFVESDPSKQKNSCCMHSSPSPN